MAHYDDGTWSDYLRGLVDDPAGGEMRRHLAGGCARCGGMVASLRRLQELAAAEALDQLPDGAIRSVKAFYAVQQAGHLPARSRLNLELIEDGALANAATGVRSGPATQRFTYGGGGLQLELLLQSAPPREHLTLSGELLDRQSGHLAGVPAFLVSGRDVVDQATTDELGAFLLAAEATRARLCLFLEDDRLVELDLDAPAECTGTWTVRPTHRSS